VAVVHEYGLLILGIGLTIFLMAVLQVWMRRAIVPPGDPVAVECCDGRFGTGTANSMNIYHNGWQRSMVRFGVLGMLVGTFLGSG